MEISVVWDGRLRRFCAKRVREFNFHGLSDKSANVVGFGTVALVVVLLAYRLTQGIDLGDESYYAIFLDDWLKGSISTSTLISLHQTAALIIYPITIVYVALVGSSDGMFLFLRAIYLFGACISGALWIIFLRRLGFQLLAWAGGALLIGFVPFGLPAPSYNTLGQQGLATALAAFGCAALAPRHSKSQALWLILSASAWGGATVAYPTLIVPLGLICLLGLFGDSVSFPRPWLYFGLNGAAVCTGWALVLISLSWRRVSDSAQYLAASNDVSGWSRKFDFTLNTLHSHPSFTALCLIAIVIGAIRPILPRFTPIATSLILAGLFIISPVLFLRSHDVISVAAIMGIGFLFGFRQRANSKERLVAYLYATSLTAAIAIYATAYNSVYNFAVGALPAALLSCLGFPPPRSERLTNLLPVSVAIFGVLATSLWFYYGELPDQTGQQKKLMNEGFFAGIHLSPEHDSLVRTMQNNVEPLIAPGERIAVFGRSPGLILATSARVNMPIAFAVGSSNKNGFAAMQEFYDRHDRPALAIIFCDAYFSAENPIPSFADRYLPVAKFKLPTATLSVFHRR